MASTLTAEKQKGGRPTKYNNEILDKARHYLDNYQELGDPIPSLAGLAQELEINKETAWAWGKDKNKSKFSKVLKELKQAQERALLAGGLNSSLNTTITKMCLTKHGYTDNPQQNQASGIQVTVNRGSVVLKAGGDTLEISDNPGRTLEHGEE